MEGTTAADKVPEPVSAAAVGTAGEAVADSVPEPVREAFVEKLLPPAAAWTSTPIIE
jgi:hypothetical protein